MKLKLGLLGFGTVGQGVKKIISEKGKDLNNNSNIDLEIVKVAVRNLDGKREVAIDSEKLTDDPLEVINHPEIDIVIEVMGGVEDTFKLLEKAIKNKKHIVTANKAVVSKYFEELHNLAKENNVSLLYEASVGGGIPVIKPVYEMVDFNNISNIKGILNGTSNYILSKMSQEGLDYGEVLKEAQDLGYAEADPYDDVEGVDALRKLRIISSIAYRQPVKEEDIIRLGMSNISKTDIEVLKSMGYIIKLIAESWIEDDIIKAIVQPMAFDHHSYFSTVNDAFNSVTVKGDMVGELKFYGAGAGMLPTAYAVLKDVIHIAKEKESPYIYRCDRNLKVDSSDIIGDFYVRSEVDLEGYSEKIEENIYIFEDAKLSDFNLGDCVVIRLRGEI